MSSIACDPIYSSLSVFGIDKILLYSFNCVTLSKISAPNIIVFFSIASIYLKSVIFFGVI